MNLLGLIGFPLSHSFSKKYFTQKFQKENIPNYQYELFELPAIEQFPQLIDENPNLVGLNVTIPHKQNVIPYLQELDENAQRIGAVNVIKKLKDGTLKGYNSDYWGFRNSLENWLPHLDFKALVLGTGGASKAVQIVLEDLGIDFHLVSRTAKDDIWSYEMLTKEIIQEHQLIINTTPLGMSPHTQTAPNLAYLYLSSEHYLYDLVYNPEETLFMKKGKERQAKVKNGLEMLHLQAEKAWEIWQA